jgi:hypothetical protein
MTLRLAHQPQCEIEAIVRSLRMAASGDSGRSRGPVDQRTQSEAEIVRDDNSLPRGSPASRAAKCGHGVLNLLGLVIGCPGRLQRTSKNFADKGVG